MTERKVVVITGANTGIGLEAVKALLRSEQSYDILLGGRDIEKAQQAAKAVSSEAPPHSSVAAFQVDVESDDSIEAAYAEIAKQHAHVDCLVNNAGASFDAHIDKTMTTRQAWNKAWDVNVTGAHIMTHTFLPLLLQSPDPRLLFITSGISSLEGAALGSSNPANASPPAGLPKPQSFIGYRSSKTGLNMVMTQWARILKNDHVKVWAVAPGLLATSLGGDTDVLKKMGAKDPSIGGEVIRGVIEGKRDADTGRVVREYASPVQPW